MLIKLGLLAGIVGLGWLQPLAPPSRPARGRGGGRAPGRAGVALRRTLRAELAIAVVVLGTTGALAGYPPAEAVSAGPFSTDAALGPARLEVTVEPARVGSERGPPLPVQPPRRQPVRPHQGAHRARLPAGPAHRPDRARRAARAGPGHYVVTSAAFGVAGDWRVEVAARVSEFDEHRTTFKVPIQ